MTKLRQNQKDRLRKAAIQGSRFYNHYLLDKTFVIVTEDYLSCSVTFLKKDFCHFTGLSLLHLTNNNFFDVCYKGTLSDSNIEDNQHYNYSTLKSKANTLLKLNKFLHVDASVNLFLSGLATNTYSFPYAIRNDRENMTICFMGNDNHARSLRKAKNSHNVISEKRILAIFEKENCILEKCIYIRDKKIVEHMDQDSFSEHLKRYFHLN